MITADTYKEIYAMADVMLKKIVRESKMPIEYMEGVKVQTDLMEEYLDQDGGPELAIYFPEPEYDGARDDYTLIYEADIVETCESEIREAIKKAVSALGYTCISDQYCVLVFK